MIEFGKTLKSSREAKGFTISQIAEMTRLKPSTVEGLENEDFSGIAAPIYGRGFVKLYCEAVGIDPKPLVEEFMEILNGNREIAIKERPTTEVQPPPAPSVQPAPVPEPDLFSKPEPVTPAAPEPQSAAATPEPSFSRFAAPIREDRIPTGFNLVNPRILVLAGCAFALLIVLVLGIRTLYRATTSDAAEAKSDETVVETAAEEPRQNVPIAKPASRTQQQSIPSLYID